MDLVAGDARDIVLALSVDDTAAFDDQDRFVAHLPLGGGLDPTWLDLFSEAVRSRERRTTTLLDFLDAGPSSRTAVARPSGSSSGSTPTGSRPSRASRTTRSDALAGRWIELLEEELGVLRARGEALDPRLAGRIVGFSPGGRPAPATWSSPGPSDRRVSYARRGRAAPASGPW